MPTETITLKYGNPGSSDIIENLISSTFQWTITNVGSTGTFADGTPWIVMGSTGSYLTDISPRSYGITSTHSYNPTFYYINGSAKNLHTSVKKYNKNNLTLVNGDPIHISSPVVFDSRLSYIDFTYGITFNIGYTSGGIGAALNPIGLTFGDNIMTADSFWIQPGDPAIGQQIVSGYTLSYDGLSGPNKPNGIQFNIRNSDGTLGTRSPRSALKRLGIVNVLQSAPTEKCFRPPAQWKDSTTRPLIPVSHAKGVTAIADVLGYYNSSLNPYSGTPDGITFGYDALNSLVYHGGYELQNESFVPLLAMNGTKGAISYDFAAPYYKSLTIELLLWTMTNTFFSVSKREEARNRLIQYGIDAFGSVMAGNGTVTSGGHSIAELLEPILITGWLIGSTYGNQMVDIINTIRGEYPGVSGYSDTLTGAYFFKSYNQYGEVGVGSTLGSFHRQTWTPTGPSDRTYVVSAEEVEFANIRGLSNMPVGGLLPSPWAQCGYQGNPCEAYCPVEDTYECYKLGTTPRFTCGQQCTTGYGFIWRTTKGKYAKLNVAGGGLLANSSYGQARGFKDYYTGKNSGAFYNYPGCYVKVTDGPGAGPTVYKILEVGPYLPPGSNGQYDRAGDYLILDRPWINGTPDATSTVECYPFRTGQYSFDGSTADVGRHVYYGTPGLALGTPFSYNWGYPTLYFENYAYGSTTFNYHLTFWNILKKIHEVTGNANFVQSPGFKHYTQNFLGYHKDIATEVPFSTTPREEYFLHLGWLNQPYDTYPFRFARLSDTVQNIFKQWIGFTGSTGYGTGEWTKIPGYALKYNATDLAGLLGDFGKPGRYDYNSSGAADSADLAWFLGKWNSQ